MPETENQFQLPLALAASTAIHAAVLALLLLAGASTNDFVTPMAETKVELLPVRLVSRTGGGGGGPLPGLPSAPKGPPDLPTVAHDSPAPLPRVAAAPPPVVAPKPVAKAPDSTTTAAFRKLVPTPPSPTSPARVAKAAPPAPPAAPAGQAATRRAGDQAGDAGAIAALGGPGGGGGRGGGGAGTGNGTGGDGSDASARPAYGTNPKPPYPLAARRLGVEGVVTLEVLVRADGHPAEVHVRRSSGSPLLDDSAVQTVRSKWRFMPARRGNATIDSRVTFPIRFSLDAG